jgi:hypothetical protein
LRAVTGAQPRPRLRSRRDRKHGLRRRIHCASINIAWTALPARRCRQGSCGAPASNAAADPAEEERVAWLQRGATWRRPQTERVVGERNSSFDNVGRETQIKTTCPEHADGKIKSLVIIAAPRTLGEVRRNYDKSLSEVLLGELDKNLTGHSVQAIAKALAAACPVWIESPHEPLWPAFIELHFDRPDTRQNLTACS